MLGRLLVPKLMEKYQTDDEQPLSKAVVDQALLEAGWTGAAGYFDFFSTPLAGLFPSWETGYRLCRALDEGLIRLPGLARLSSNLEIVAKRR
jgi:hypothetical protein